LILKGQTRDPNTLRAQSRKRLGSEDRDSVPKDYKLEMAWLWGIKWSRDP